MLALVCITIVMVLLLAVLVVGLLRSHADILRALHSLGAGVGDPAGEPSDQPMSGDRMGGRRGDASSSGPLVIGPPLPPERDTSSVPDVVGLTPEGDAISVAVGGVGHHTLLAFLSSGCATCAGFWDALAQPALLELPPGVRPVVVTKGIEHESPSELSHRGAVEAGVPVIMSTDTWEAYEVPGSPFFVLVDGPRAQRVGEGSGMRMEQISRMVRQAIDESRAGAVSRAIPDPEGADRRRESDNDRLLLAAGIHPGHTSLYPSSIEDVVPTGWPREPGVAEWDRTAGPVPGAEPDSAPPPGIRDPSGGRDPSHGGRPDGLRMDERRVDGSGDDPAHQRRR